MNIFNNLDTIIGILGFGFGIWQYKKASNLQKVVNDHIRGLYNDSKAVLEFAKKKDNYQTIGERARAIKTSIIRLDIINRNLDQKKISDLGEKGLLDSSEVTEYKKFSSN